MRDPILASTDQARLVPCFRDTGNLPETGRSSKHRRQDGYVYPSCCKQLILGRCCSLSENVPRLRTLCSTDSIEMTQTDPEGIDCLYAFQTIAMRRNARSATILRKPMASFGCLSNRQTKDNAESLFCKLIHTFQLCSNKL